MLKAMTARRSDDRGFTLVELMVVVLIIGILVAIAIPTFLNARKTAENTAAQANLRNAYSVAKAYQAANGGNYGTDKSKIVAEDTSLPWADPIDTVAAGKIAIISLTNSTITLSTKTASGVTVTATEGATGGLAFSSSSPSPS